jgi:hypothetical protein
MQVFVEFVRSDVTEDQILPVLRELLPVLMNILLSQAVGFLPLFFHLLLRDDVSSSRMAL